MAADPNNSNYNNDGPVIPLREKDGLSVDQWFGHGYKGFPPASGDFMVLPAGGVYTGEWFVERVKMRLTKYRRSRLQSSTDYFEGP
jgi:hypothetical protein